MNIKELGLVQDHASMIVLLLATIGVLYFVRAFIRHLRTPKNKAEGFSLLEMMFVCLIITILASIALPNARTMLLYMQQREAHEQVRQVRDVEVAYAQCTNPAFTPPRDCSTLEHLLLSEGVWTMNGYTFTFHVLGSSGNWNYTAVPITPGTQGYYLDQSGVILCGSNSSGSPCQ